MAQHRLKPKLNLGINTSSLRLPKLSSDTFIVKEEKKPENKVVMIKKHKNDDDALF